VGIRVTEEEEQKGLDLGEHEMRAYADSVGERATVMDLKVE